MTLCMCAANKVENKNFFFIVLTIAILTYILVAFEINNIVTQMDLLNILQKYLSGKTFIMSPKRSLGDILRLLRLLLWLPNEVCETYYFCAQFLIIIITSPRLLSGDVLLFYVSFSLLLWLPNVVCETYYFCSVSYYYYQYYSCHIHIQWNEISQNKSESVGQTLPQLPWK